MTELMSLRLGVDVGGTFTDLVLFDTKTNALEFAKTPSTTDNQAIGVAAGIDKIARQMRMESSVVDFLAHGTTVATNALLERRGADTAVLVTEGFRDVLQIGRQDRPRLYDWFAQRPEPLVPRHRCFEIRERVLYTGEVHIPLDESQAAKSIQAAKASGARALAVCLLHAYANPRHERRLLELIRDLFPEADVSLSSEILPEFKEYERMSTTVANAYVLPGVRRYVEALERRVLDLGIGSGIHIMQSNGGLMTARAAGEHSVRTMLSGPAAGALGAVWLARQAGLDNVVTVDMGGTSFDICLAHDGQIGYTRESEIAGLPIKVPMLDLHTLGAGGGSIAWIDGGGALRAGPMSAGAEPGPACYARGGTQPTVTDANLVLGRLNPAFFLGGEIQLDAEAARRAIAEHVATPLGLSVEAAAEGILRVVNATMIRGMRSVSVEKGYDPRDFALVAFGGGGPVHASDLARDFGAPHILVPLAPGVTSALGLLLADLRYDFSATYLRPLEAVELGGLRQVYATLEHRAVKQMRQDGVADAQVVLSRGAAVRYVRQGFELEVAVPGGVLGEAALERIREAFHAAHAQQYGYAMRSETIVLVNAEVTAIAHLPKPDFTRVPSAEVEGRVATPTGGRPVYARGVWLQAAIYDRTTLEPGMAVDGPAIVEQVDSTTVLLPGDRGRVDQFQNLMVSMNP
ncbi:MAG: hydantoinase/oxoprolinase family protein [Chloroflexi bacterium]|nr:hydantoinase/oxoprolinase family protein [Chloroflexota bacterium]